MLAAGQMVGKERAVGHQLAALLPPGHLHPAAAAPVAPAVLLLPPGLQHLVVALAASLRQKKNIDAVGNAPPALILVARPPATGIAAIFDALAETQNVDENERPRADLTANILRDRGEFLAPYIG